MRWACHPGSLTLSLYPSASNAPTYILSLPESSTVSSMSIIGLAQRSATEVYPTCSTVCRVPASARSILAFSRSNISCHRASYSCNTILPWGFSNSPIVTFPDNLLMPCFCLLVCLPIVSASQNEAMRHPHCKNSASERQSNSFGIARAPPVLFKDSASERQSNLFEIARVPPAPPGQRPVVPG